MQPSESAWVKYIHMTEQGWTQDIFPQYPLWRRGDESMLMSEPEVLIWEKVNGVAAADIRREFRQGKVS